MESLTDPLTGIANRRALITELAKTLQIVKRAQARAYIAFIDLDNFKIINDQHGHDAGDRLLLEIAQRLKTGIRDSDFVARYGGDEFVIIGLDFTGEHATSGETFRLKVENLTRGQFNLGNVNLNYPGASVGVTTINPDDTDYQAILTRADAQMYQFKQSRKRA